MIVDNFSLFIDRLIQFDNEFEVCVTLEQKELPSYEIFDQFAKLHRTRTTNRNERKQRISILNNYMVRS